MKQQQQILRYSDDELRVLNDTFSERQDLLVLLRKFFLQGKLTDAEREGVKLFSTPNLIEIIKKTYLPEIDLTTPIGQLADLWSNVNTRDNGVEAAWLEMAARELLIKYIKDRFTDLINGTEGGLRLESLEYDSGEGKEKNFINLSARNSILAHVDFQTGQLWVLAGRKKESDFEIQKRLFRDSSK